MDEWTFYTLADWWNPLAWTWQPLLEHHPASDSFSWIFFSIVRRDVT